LTDESTDEQADDPTDNDRNRAVVLLSGGLDSATTLALARSQHIECHTLALNYGQRHSAELLAAAQVSADLGASSHRVVSIDLRAIGGSALTDDDIEVPEQRSEGIPLTYVPARNTVLLSVALGLAETLEAGAIHIGVNSVDYSGYPDCRPAFIAAFQDLAQVATASGINRRPIEIVTPLIHLSKAEIIRRGTALGLNYARTVSCYQADPAGRACGRCESCAIRRDGFAAAGIPDPTRYA